MRRFILCVCVALMLAPACMDVPRYQHEPTRELFKTYELDAPELAPFTVDGVVTRPTVVQGHPRVSLSFVSKAETSVRLLRIRLDGIDVEVGEDVPIVKKSTSAALFVGYHEVSLYALMDGKRFDQLGEDGYELTVELESGTVEFEITTMIEKVPSCGGW